MNFFSFILINYIIEMLFSTFIQKGGTMSMNNNLQIFRLQEMLFPELIKSEGGGPSVSLDQRVANFIQENEVVLLVQMRMLDKYQIKFLINSLQDKYAEQPTVKKFIKSYQFPQDLVVRKIFFTRALLHWSHQVENEAVERILTAWVEKSSTLCLSGLNLDSLPPQIAQLNHLKEIDLSDNNFSTIPPEIENHPSLSNVIISGNPLNEPFRFKKSFSGSESRSEGPTIIGESNALPSVNDSLSHWSEILPIVADYLEKDKYYFGPILYEITQNVDGSFGLLFPSSFGGDHFSMEMMSEEKFLNSIWNPSFEVVPSLPDLLGSVRDSVEQLQQKFEKRQQKFEERLSFEGEQLNGKTEVELRKTFKSMFNLEGVNVNQLSKTRCDASCISPRHENTAVFFYPKSSVAAGDHLHKTFFAFNDARIFRMLKTAQKKNVVIKLVDSIEDINAVLKIHKNISLVEIGAHGDQDSIEIGDGFFITEGNLNEIDTSNVKEGSTFLLSSCETGAGEVNIASKMSEVMASKGITVIAPKVSISGGDIRRVRVNSCDEEGPIYETVMRKDEQDVTRCYHAGSILKEVNLNVCITNENYQTLSFMDKELQGRFFNYLKDCGWTTLHDETITMDDWLKNSRYNQMMKNEFISLYSRVVILKETLESFYKTQHLAYILTFDQGI
jgi:hypothetical protein